MATKAPWAGLKSKFRELRKIPEAWRLTATNIDGEWRPGDWPRDPNNKKQLQESFEARARLGIELVGEEGWGTSLDQWLDLLRADGRGKRMITGGSSESYYIQDVVQASIEYCAAMDEHASNAAPAQTRLEDVEMTFINENEVRVRINGKVENMTFSEIGLADKRRIDRPDLRWEMLLSLARRGGIIPRELRTPAKAGSMDKCKDRLCEALKERFGIPSNSIKLAPEGYVAQFKVSVGPWFATDDIE
jgi:hypothetical protein